MSIPDPKPTIGRTVDYTSAGTRAVRAAFISDVHTDGTVTLHVLNPHPDASRPVGVMHRVSYANAGAGTPAAENRWTWPARV